MTRVVENILAQIDALDEAQQDELRVAMRRRDRDRWNRLIEPERRRSAAEGLTEEDVNRAVAEMRYGKKSS